MTDTWFIVQTNPNSERKAVAEMRRAGFRAHMPRLARVKRHYKTGEPSVPRRALFVGYVFMRFNGPANWYAMRECQGVKGVLYIDGHPFRLGSDVVAGIMRHQRAMTFEDGDTRAVRREMRKGGKDARAAAKEANRKRFSPGMQISAPMSGAERLLARVIAVTKKGTVKAVVTMDGHETSVEFTDLDMLQIVDREAA